MKKLQVLLSIVLTASVVAPSLASETITTGDLLRQMHDLRVLTEFPSPAYTVVQFSSYDRRSQIPGGPGWFANSDGFGNEPIPAFEAVLKAPGDDGIGEYLICDVQEGEHQVRSRNRQLADAGCRADLQALRRPLRDHPPRQAGEQRVVLPLQPGQAGVVGTGIAHDLRGERPCRIGPPRLVEHLHAGKIELGDADADVVGLLSRQVHEPAVLAQARLDLGGRLRQHP
jgi:hypothetical protein